MFSLSKMIVMGCLCLFTFATAWAHDHEKKSCEAAFTLEDILKVGISFKGLLQEDHSYRVRQMFFS